MSEEFKDSMAIMSEYFYFAIFPGGDREKIAVARLTASSRYEKDQYAVASRREFSNIDEASDYARRLAEHFRLKFVSDPAIGVYLD